MSIQENNILIAEFMKVRYNERVGLAYMEKPSMMLRLDELRFHSSIDWLSPVMDKVEEVLFSKAKETMKGDDIYKATLIPTVRWSLFQWSGHNPYWTEIKVLDTKEDAYILNIGLHGDTRIEAIYKAIIEFIEWYNNHYK